MLDIQDTLTYMPNWKPLEALSLLYPDDIDCGDFMYMGTSMVKEENPRVICLYKHRNTRGYLNIDTDGECWQYNPDGYFQVAQESAIERVNS